MFGRNESPAPAYTKADFLDETVSREVLPKTEPGRDPYGAYWLHRQDLGRPLTFHTGRVVDYVSHANTYKVQVEYNHTVWAASMVSTGLQPFGARQLNTYPVGAWVLCMQHPFMPWTWIVGALPDFLTNPTMGTSDRIVQGGRSGQLADAAHAYHTDMTSHPVDNWAAGRPRDGTSAGEWGAINEHGMRVFLDGYMAALAADETTGVWAFYHDQLLRVAGHNFQLRTGVRESEDVDDQGELSSYSGLTPYAWERMGTWSRTAQVVQADLPPAADDTAAAVEPYYADQQAFGRLLEFEGYLGQLKKTMVVLPPVSGAERLRYSDRRDLDAVFDQTVAMNGAFNLRSAKRISIRKRPCIPAPKQMQKPESPLGDQPSVYRHAGNAGLGSGPAHVLPGEPAVPGAFVTHGCMHRAASASEHGAFVFNWEGSHQFYYHSADWYLPDEGTSARLRVTQVPPAFQALAVTQYLDAPSPETVPVDHRSAAKYWPNESGIDFLDDGGVVLFDGFGGEIRMTGGSIFISAPGDVFLQPGRNVNLWAGRDVIAKAADCVDVTASCGDVRVKAENNLLMLGGNNSVGGVVIESRATCAAFNYAPGSAAVFSGVTLKAEHSNIAFYGRNVLTKALPDADGTGGRVETDAGEAGVLRTHGTYHERFIGQAAFDFFVAPGTCDVAGANEWWAEHAALGCNLSVSGRTDLGACLRVNDWIMTSGHIATALATDNNGLVNQLSDVAAQVLEDEFAYLEDREFYLYGTAIEECTNSSSQGAFDPDYAHVGFNLRTDNQYRGGYGLSTGDSPGPDFYIYESRWQQMARYGAGAPKVWTEPGVFDPNGATQYPYPGKHAWTGASGYRMIAPTMFDMINGVSQPRGPLYESATYGPAFHQRLDARYTIVG